MPHLFLVDALSYDSFFRDITAATLYTLGMCVCLCVLCAMAWIYLKVATMLSCVLYAPIYYV